MLGSHIVVQGVPKPTLHILSCHQRNRGGTSRQYGYHIASKSSAFIGFLPRPTKLSTPVECQASQNGKACAAPESSVSVVLLAGGVGKRFGAAIPKQYLDLKGAPIATYSLKIFSSLPEVFEIVVVCEKDWEHIFRDCYASLDRKLPLKFARPGAERQDSVANGFAVTDESAQLVAIHDSARPLVTPDDIWRCFSDAWNTGAAVLGVPVKPTIKEADSLGRVVQTLQRSKLWEVQTPQVIRPALLKLGFEKVIKEGLEVTDDVSIIEALGEPVQITPGSYTNIKVTTPEDMSVAERFVEEHALRVYT